MPDSSSPVPQPSSPRLDRSALERVLARAAELQSDPNDTGEDFTEDQLVELGKEVGLSPQNLRQALAEERTKSIAPLDERGIAAGLFGPSRVRADRTVSGKPDEVLAAIDSWMQRQELLIVKRHHADRIVWEPRNDFLVGIKRALRVGGRDYALSLAFEASATAIAVDDARVHVGLDADFHTRRSLTGQHMAATTVIGAAGTGALILMGVTVFVAVAPVVLLPAIGLTALRAYQARVVTRAQLALEQLLDRLERGDYGRRRPDSIIGAIVAAATALPPRR